MTSTGYCTPCVETPAGMAASAARLSSNNARLFTSAPCPPLLEPVCRHGSVERLSVQVDIQLTLDDGERDAGAPLHRGCDLVDKAAPELVDRNLRRLVHLLPFQLLEHLRDVSMRV